MTQSHDDVVSGKSRNLQTLGKRFSFNNQRMISTGLKMIIHSLEDRFAIMTDFRCLSMHQLGSAHHLPSKSLTDCLVAKADAQQWNLSGKTLNHLQGDARVIWGTRPRGDHDSFRSQFQLDFIDRYAIISAYLQHLPQLS